MSDVWGGVRRAVAISALAGLMVGVAGCNNGERACDSDRDCSSLGGVCDFTRGVCVQCNNDVDCLSDSQACMDHVCRDVTFCASSRECPGLVCDTLAGYCVECLSDVDCPGTERCSAEHTCRPAPVPCSSDRQCSAMDMVCDVVIGECVDCVLPADCPVDAFCIAGECVR